MNHELKRAYIEKMNFELQNWSTKLEELKLQLSQGKADLRSELDSQMLQWKEQEESIKAKLEELRLANIEKFETLKFYLQTSWKDLLSSFEDNKLVRL